MHPPANQQSSEDASDPPSPTSHPACDPPSYFSRAHWRSYRIACVKACHSDKRPIKLRQAVGCIGNESFAFHAPSQEPPRTRHLASGKRYHDWLCPRSNLILLGKVCLGCLPFLEVLVESSTRDRVPFERVRERLGRLVDSCHLVSR